MLFKPKYCCSCGEKIERLDWGLKTSRRFCEICETEHLFEEWASVLAAVVALFVGVFGATLLQSSARAEMPKDPVVQRAPASDLKNRNALPPDSKEPKAGESSPKGESFFCGAPTKKGTPCTRRVTAKGNLCWQHRRQ